MRRVVGFLGSLGLALVLAGVGLIIDAWSLIYSGVVIFVLMASLWLYEWGRTAPKADLATAQIDEGPPTSDESRGGLSNTKLEVHKARSYARTALADRRNYERNVARMESALTSVKKTFGLDTPDATGEDRADLQLWLDYFDVVWPFLENGNYEQAKARAVRFLAERQAR